jgi:hypothetical protein
MGKFKNLYESAIQRFTRGGFLVGDLVRIKESSLNDAFFKKQATNYIDKVKEFISSGLNIRISAVKPVYPNAFAPGNIQSEAESFLCDIVLEKAPGLYYSFITIPAHLLEHIDTGINLAPVPDALKRPNNEIMDPEPVNKFNDPTTYMSPYRQTSTTDKGDNKDVKSEISLPTVNVKIPASTAEGEKDPASYTARYLPKKR